MKQVSLGAIVQRDSTGMHNTLQTRVLGVRLEGWGYRVDEAHPYKTWVTYVVSWTGSVSAVLQVSPEY